MHRLLWEKIKEALISVLPVTLIVIILHFTPLIDLTNYELIVFIVCGFLLILGIGLFNIGADMSMQPMGNQVGSTLTKTKKISLMVIISFLLGFLITVAEPDLTVLANQVSEVINPILLIVFIGLGVGLFLVFGVLKILFKKDLSMMLMFFYFIMFALISILIMNKNENFLGLAIDSGGVTTGPITVPFIMALGVGIANTIGGRNKSENSFGLIALCSIGPILATLILTLFIDSKLDYVLPNYNIDNEFFKAFFNTFFKVGIEVLISLSMIIIFFLVINYIFIKLPKKKIYQILIGLGYTFLGLVIFLTSVSIGFMPVGFKIGAAMAKNKVILTIFGFIIGLVVVLAEPAVHVLKKQVEDITNGGVSKKAMVVALSIGVGLSICLSMIRIIYDFSILYYLIPGYFISLGLSLFVPKIYTAIAFDSGGVASGPLTSSFILPFAVGATIVLQGEHRVMFDAFGIVAMVAMTPLITIQLLGFKSVLAKKVYKKKQMRRLETLLDEQIIEF